MTYPLPLSPGNLTLPKEKTYFTILAVVSALVWLVVTVSVIGLFYGLLIAFGAWLANGLLIARLKAGAVRIDEKQLPELWASHGEVCEKLGLKEIPRLYLLQSGGILNAFATRHSGRDFVVIYSSMLEALGNATPEVKFLLGHEIGHIRSKHLLKRLFLLPGFLIPLLGKAYHRACEATCDRFGAFAAGDADGAIRAMLTLGAGRENAPRLAPEAFAEQHFAERGFFVSWHELDSTYPTLSQRAANLLAVKNAHFRGTPERNPLAYVFAFFTLSLRGVAVIYVAVILSVLAIPAIQAAQTKARHNKALLEEHRRSFSGRPADSDGTPVVIPTLPPPVPAPVADAPKDDAKPADAPAPAPAAPAAN